MNKRVIKLLVLFLLVAMFGYSAYSLVNKSKKTDVGDQAYNFSLPNLNGATTKLSDFKGQMVVLNYFTTWCDPCRQEAPELERFSKDYGNKYKLIMINRGETKDRVQQFINKYHTKAEYVFDYNSKVSEVYNVTGQPETFVIDRKGVIRKHYNGPVSEVQLNEWLQTYDR